MKKLIFVVTLFLYSQIAGLYAQNLPPEIDSPLITAADLRTGDSETAGDEDGYHWYVRKKPGVESVVLLTEDGTVIDESHYAEPDEHYGESFHLILPYTVARVRNTKVILRTGSAESPVVMGQGTLESDIVYEDAVSDFLEDDAAFELTLVEAQKETAAQKTLRTPPTNNTPAKTAATTSAPIPAETTSLSINKPSPAFEDTAVVKKQVPSLIMGKGSMSQNTLASFLRSKNPRISHDYATLIAQIYVYECLTEGVNHDVAFAQMCLETGYLRFNGILRAESNNFGALGAVSVSNRGNSFRTPQEGARAQIQHLKAYASTKPIVGTIIDPRYKILQELRYIGSAPTIRSLSGKWATDPSYGNKITAILNELYQF